MIQETTEQYKSKKNVDNSCFIKDKRILFQKNVT